MVDFLPYSIIVVYRLSGTSPPCTLFNIHSCLAPALEPYLETVDSLTAWTAAMGHFLWRA